MRRILRQWPAIVPALILVLYSLFFRWLSEFYVADGFGFQQRAIVVIVVFSVVVPLVCLGIEIFGLCRAVRAYCELDPETLYSVKRRSLGLVFLYGGEILMTLLWLGASVYLAIPMLSM